MQDNNVKLGYAPNVQCLLNMIQNIPLCPEHHCTPPLPLLNYRTFCLVILLHIRTKSKSLATL